MPHGTRETFRDLAGRHLPADAAERWLGLLRPSARLTAAVDSDLVVGQLGGVPKLPADVAWPVWEGHGPLTFIASVDCAALPPGALNIALPAAGTLHFFYFDGQVDDGEAVVMADDRESRAGARVVYAPAGSEASERRTPIELRPYPRVPLTVRTEMTAAEPWHPEIQGAFAPDAPPGSRYDHPVCGQEFLDALWELGGTVGHQIGGHASPVQNPVELEVAHAVLEGTASWVDPKLVEEAGSWLLLAQFDSDEAADMMWGDGGALYWLIRPEDLAHHRFDRAMFTWQCS